MHGADPETINLVLASLCRTRDAYNADGRPDLAAALNVIICAGTEIRDTERREAKRIRDAVELGLPVADTPVPTTWIESDDDSDSQ